MNSNEEVNIDGFDIAYYLNEDGTFMEDDSDDAESAVEEHFDITLAASHSYLGSELKAVHGLRTVEEGWSEMVSCFVHGSCVFPGETIPLMLLDYEDAVIHIINNQRLFALLCPDENSETLSGYCVLCQVIEVSQSGPGRILARAVHRCRIISPLPPNPNNITRQLEVVVLPEVILPDPLRSSRLACLDSHRHASALTDRGLRAMDAIVTPWPLFVFDLFNFECMRATIEEYFKTLGQETLLPTEPVALSYWVARNLTLNARDRLALFTADNALLRLHLECRFISRKSVVCCVGCLSELARREHVFPMSSDGIHSTYTNPGGHLHDVVTVTRACNTVPRGDASTEFSWFPGYKWTVLECARCSTHVGWRFDAIRSNLRPDRFYGLRRNYVQPNEVTPFDSNDPLQVPLEQIRLT